MRFPKSILLLNQLFGLLSQRCGLITTVTVFRIMLGFMSSALVL